MVRNEERKADRVPNPKPPKQQAAKKPSALTPAIESDEKEVHQLDELA